MLHKRKQIDYNFFSQKYKTKLKALNLPAYSFHITGRGDSEVIFDPVRRRYVKLTPEEWVRQNFMQYLIREGGYPPGLMGVEIMFRMNRLRRRTDILIHTRNGEPVMIVECKSPDVPLNDEVFDQISTYNMKYRIPYLVVTNGLVHYACKFDFIMNKPEYLLVIPLYDELQIQK